jgi:hypothetical protein
VVEDAAPSIGISEDTRAKRVERPVDRLPGVADLDDVLRAHLAAKRAKPVLVVGDRGDDVGPVHPQRLLQVTVGIGQSGNSPSGPGTLRNWRASRSSKYVERPNDQ